MRSKRRSRPVEWGKNLLIILLALSAVYLLSRTQISSRVMDRVQGLLNSPAAGFDPTAASGASDAANPARLAIYRDGQRYGVQYDQEETDKVFSSLSTLFSEALGSAGDPEAVTEEDWRSALCRTGIYLDFLYPIPLSTLADWLGGDQSNSDLTGAARRVCLAADESDGVSLFYINEDDSSYYVCGTTLSASLHLEAAVAEQSPNGAMFAFEVSGMEDLEPYTLLTSTPQPAIYTAGNPLLEDSTRVLELTSALSFRSQTVELDPSTGGRIVEDNDSLRLSANGLVTFHTIGDSGFRFSLPEDSVRGALNYTQALAQATAGVWCGQARLCLAKVEETSNGLEITFQYCLDGALVVLPEGYAAAHFVVRGGAITDFSLYLRSYSDTGETSLVPPEEQAAAAMRALNVRGRELTLLYEDSGGEQVKAGWNAVL